MANRSDWKESEYSKKLRDPKWQKKRLEIMQRDKFTCQMCTNTQATLNVHHTYYVSGHDPWDYPGASLITLCESCHEDESINAPDAKSDLITILCQRGLLAEDLRELCTGFIQWAGHDPAIDCSVLRWAISTPEVWEALFQQYFVDPPVLPPTNVQ